jgi:hypothetical protein
MQINLKFVKGTTAAPQIQPFRDVDNRRLSRIYAKCISVLQFSGGIDGRDHFMTDLGQLFPFLRGKRLQIACDRRQRIGTHPKQAAEGDYDKSKSLHATIFQLKVDFKSSKIVVNDDRTGSEGVGFTCLNDSFL